MSNWKKHKQNLIIRFFKQLYFLPVITFDILFRLLVSYESDRLRPHGLCRIVQRKEIKEITVPGNASICKCIGNAVLMQYSSRKLSCIFLQYASDSCCTTLNASLSK